MDQNIWKNSQNKAKNGSKKSPEGEKELQKLIFRNQKRFLKTELKPLEKHKKWVQINPPKVNSHKYSIQTSARPQPDPGQTSARPQPDLSQTSAKASLPRILDGTPKKSLSVKRELQ